MVNCENKYNLNKKNLDAKISEVLDRLTLSYPNLRCKNKNCEWHDDCKRVKWVWKNDFNKNNLNAKKQGYCEMKKAINNGFYDSLKKF